MALADETIIPLSAAAKEIPGNPSLCSVFRWASKGARGRILETVLIGGRRYTSREAIRRFISHTEKRNPGSGGFSSPIAPDDAHADRALRRQGL